MNARLGFLILGLSGLAAGCTSDGNVQQEDEDGDVDVVDVPSRKDPAARRAELGITEARKYWNARRPAAYTFLWQQSCFCTEDDIRPLVVSVVGDDVVSATYATDRIAVPAERVQYLSTIDDVFDRIDDAIEQDAHYIAVTFRGGLGYPTSVVLNYDEWTADDELDLHIADVQINAR